jgi:invasion protein IalB
MISVAALVAATCLTAAHPAAAQDSAPRAGQVFGDWRFTCTAVTEDRSRCQLTQTMVAGDNRQPVARLGLGPGRDGALVFSAQLPLGLLIPSGVSIVVDEGAPMPLTLTRCVAAGCLAQRILTTEETATFRTGKAVSVRYSRTADRVIALGGSLNGISSALDATGWGS